MGRKGNYIYLIKVTFLTDLNLIYKVVTVNCLSDSVLTLTKHKSIKPDQYNLHLVEQYKDSLVGDLSFKNGFKDEEKVVIRVPMPR